MTTPHSGAYPTGGTLAGVLVLEYLYKKEKATLGSNETFSAQYFRNCMQPNLPDYQLVWPHELWEFLEKEGDRQFLPNNEHDTLKWTGGKEKCTDTGPNIFADNSTVTSSHLNLVDDVSLLELSDKSPVAVCINVQTSNPTFFYYSSGT